MHLDLRFRASFTFTARLTEKFLEALSAFGLLVQSPFYLYGMDARVLVILLKKADY